MGKDMAPITSAHLTPILLTRGPPRKQTAPCVSVQDGKQGVGNIPVASIAYNNAVLYMKENQFLAKSEHVFCE